MILITDVLKQLGINKTQFFNMYKELVWESLKTKISSISVKDFEKIKKKIENEVISKKKNGSKNKVIKSDEFENKTGFLSWLWFGMQSWLETSENNSDGDIVVSKTNVSSVNEEVTFVKKIEKENNEKKEVKKVHKPTFDFSSTKKTFDKKNTTFVVWEDKNMVLKAAEAKKAAFVAEKEKKRQMYKKKVYPNMKKKVKPIAPVAKVKKESTTSANLIKKEEIIIDKNISVKEFSEKMWVALPDVMRVLLKNQIMVWLNASLDFDTAVLVATEFGIIVKKKESKLEVESFLTWDLQAILDLDKWSEVLEERAPIITVMGHVDHGKTTLLDYLRKTVIADWEAGGITQSIWASVVDYEGKKITFIDTPGHELFTSLRARGAKLTNIAVIVVAADDSVMPQTIESINHAKAAWVPVIIAVTKIDKPWVAMDRIKTDIAQYWLTPEDWGGDTPIVWVSGKTWEWISDLLDAILLQSEMLELKYNPKRSAVGVVLDAYKDPKQWVVASIIIMTWVLHLRDVIVAYNTYGKIRRMRDWKWKNIGMVKWWEPVQVLWFTELPEPGRIVEIVPNEKDAHQKVNLIQEQRELEKKGTTMQQFLSQLWSDTTNSAVLNLILKSDWSSSLEALQQAVNGISLPKKVGIKIIHANVGLFSDSDLSLAQASSALLLWFNVPVSPNMKKKSQSVWVDVKSFNIIYELTEYLEQVTLWMVEIEYEEVAVGKLDVLWIFFKKWKEVVLWWKVIEWKVLRWLNFRVIRWEEILWAWKMESLQVEQQAIKEVEKGFQCGMKIEFSKKIVLWDILEFYQMQEVKEWK